MVKRLEMEALFFVILGAVAGLFLVAYTKSQPMQFRSNAALPVQTVPLTPTATPTVAFVPTTTTTSQISSDGTKKVVVQATSNKDRSNTYTAAVDDGPTIFTTTLAPDESLTIPFNTWSSNNNYFFLHEQTKSGQKILVFQATGESFANGEQYLDLTKIFEERATSDIFDQATGWAEGNLIVINTKHSDNTQGASYWFEVPNGTLIQLSTKF